MPTPDSHPDEQWLPSPVPRYSVRCLGSVGSRYSAPVECWSSASSVRRFQSGFVARALSVRQTPPPAGVAHTRHLFFFCPQLGETTSAVMRLAVWFVAPLNDVTPGWTANCRGPYCVQLPPFPSPKNPRPSARRRASRLAIRANVACARATTAGGIALAGYVRMADSYAAALAGPRPGVSAADSVSEGAAFGV